MELGYDEGGGLPWEFHLWERNMGIIGMLTNGDLSWVAATQPLAGRRG